MKKVKTKEQEIKLGKKIKDVKINQKQHFLFFVTMLILFNLVMLGSVWFLLMNLSRWYNWAICIILLAFTFAMSFKVYCDTKTFHKCELYDNAIVMNSIWFNLVVGLNEICELNIKESFLDKVFKINTKSLEVKLIGRKRKKFTIHFIEESVVKLKTEILKLIEK